MKWFGAILIIAATTWIGFVAAKRLSERTRQLRQIKVALQSLEAEIVYGLTPLTEAAAKVADHLTEPVSTFFRTFSEILLEGQKGVAESWNESLNKTKQTTCLEKGEIEILKQFGATLGQHDREHQQKQIKLTLLHLEREEAEAREAQLRYEKMMKSLGFLTGLLVVILLL